MSTMTAAKAHAHERVFFWPARTAKTLLPLDITVKKRGAAQPPTDGVIVKIGDVLEIKLNDIPQEKFPLNRDQIVWHQRQLKGDGSFTDWQPIGDHARGVKFEHTTTTGGIYQIRAMLIAGGQEQEHLYLRKKDTPANFITDSFGNHATIYARGQPDFVGVVDADWQIAVRNKARADLGITKYARSADLPAYAGRGKYWPTDNKCNAFVYDKAVDAGCLVPADDWSWRQLYYYPPSAHEWWDPNGSIANWLRLPNDAFPQPGYIVAGPEGAGGHVGIFDYDGAWVNAGTNTVNKYPHRTFCVTEPYFSSGSRTYTSSAP